MDKKEKLLQQANQEYTNENYRLALDLYNELLELDPNNYVALLKVEDLKEKVALIKENEADVSAEMKIFHSTLLRLAKSSKDNQMYEKSINLYKQILETDSNNIQALEGLVEIYQAQGDIASANSYLTKIDNIK